MFDWTNISVTRARHGTFSGTTPAEEDAYFAAFADCASTIGKARKLDPNRFVADPFTYVMGLLSRPAPQR